MRKVSYGKSEAVWSYMSQTIYFSSGIVVLPFAITYLRDQELFIWLLLSNLSTFSVLLDTGFQGTISKLFSNVTGNREINSVGRVGCRCSEYDSKENGSYLLYCSDLVYRKISIALCITVFAILLVYIFKLDLIRNLSGPRSVYLNVVLSFVLYMFHLYITTRFVYFKAVLKGCGRIVESQKSIVYSKLLYVALSYILLFSEFGLFGICLAQFVSTLVYRYLLYKSVANLRLFYDFPVNKISDDRKNTIKANMEFNVKFSGGTVVLDFVKQRFVLLVSPFFIGIQESGELLLVFQVLSVFLSISLTGFNSRLPLFAYDIANDGEVSSLSKKRIFLSLGLGLLLFSFVSAIFIGLKSRFPDLLGGKFSDVNDDLFFVLFIFLLFDGLFRSSIVIIGYLNKYPFLQSYALTVLLSIVVSLSLFFLGKGAVTVYMSTLTVFSVYVFWKWPLYLLRLK